MIKNLLLFCISTLLILIILNYVAKIYIEYDIKNEQISHKTFEEFKIYDKYVSRLHHLKVSTLDGKAVIFEGFEENKTNKDYKKRTILFQGDSWTEGFSNKKSKQLIENYLNKNKYIAFNAGMSSYSFSPMTVQLKIIRKDFKIHPNIIIALIDYTDVGDEICRYYNKLIFDNNNNLISVKNESLLSNDFPNQSLFIKKYKIFYSKKYFSLNKIIIYSYFKLKRKFFKNKTRCTWSNNASYLKKELTYNNKEILINATSRYISQVFKDDRVEKLILVFHPHKQHFDNNLYVFKWSEIINEIKLDKKFNDKLLVIDFSRLVPDIYLTKNIDFDQIYIKNDPASHLSEDAHKIFTENILKILANNI